MAKSLKKTKKTKKIVKRQPSKSTAKKRVTSMDIAEMRDFISFIAQTGLSEVDIETGGLRLHVKRNVEQLAAPSPPAAPPDHTFSATPSLPLSKEQEPQVDKEEKKHVEVKSPMIGTFYRSANPKADPFVSVGDTIKKGQVLCIVEAMKLFNEIESDISGTVVEVLVENASPVEYEQPLFLIDVD